MRMLVSRVLLAALCIVAVLYITIRPLRSVAVPVDPDGFTAYFADALQRAVPRADVAVAGPLTLTVRPTRDSAATVSLDTIYPRVRDAPLSDRAEVAAGDVARIASLLLAGDRPVKLEAVRAVVRPKAYVDDVRREFGDEGEPVTAPLPGGLALLGMLDEPNAIQVLRPEDLKTLGLTPAAAIDLAERNLADELKPLDPDLVGKGPYRIVKLTGDPYESSRFLLTQSWAVLAERFDGSLIVALPATDTILYSGIATDEAIKALQQRAQEIAAVAGRPVSTAVFRWTADGWQVAAE